MAKESWPYICQTGKKVKLVGGTDKGLADGFNEAEQRSGGNNIRTQKRNPVEKKKAFGRGRRKTKGYGK